MGNVVNILGANIHNVTMKGALEKVKEFLKEDRAHVVYTPNSEIIMASTRTSELRDIINSADLTIPDGAGVVIGSKILGSPLPERVTGCDLLTNMFEDDYIKSRPVFLLGANEEVVQKAAANLKDMGVNICGFRNGYFTPEDEKSIVESINHHKPEILLVALGAPKQEKWIHKYRDSLNVKLCIGVGGAFNVISGVTNRGPDILVNNNLEWLYRLYKEPWRFRRMLDLPRFLVKVIYCACFKKTSK